MQEGMTLNNFKANKFLTLLCNACYVRNLPSLQGEPVSKTSVRGVLPNNKIGCIATLVRLHKVVFVIEDSNCIMEQVILLICLLFTIN